MKATNTPAHPVGGRADVANDMRQLIVDLREAARDGRGLARRYSELLEKVVEEYCIEFEMRAEAVLARLDGK